MREVLLLYFHICKNRKQFQHENIILTAKRIIEIWNALGHDPQDVYRVARKIEILVANYKAMRRNRSRTSVKGVRRYLENILGIFDISKDSSKINKNRPAASNAEINLCHSSTVYRSNNQIAGSSSMNVPLIFATSPQYLHEIEPDSNVLAHSPNTLSTASNVTIDNIRPLRSLRSTRICPIEIQEQIFIPDRDICALYERAGISHRMASLLYLCHAKHFGAPLEKVTCSRATMGRLRHQYQIEESQRLMMFNMDWRYTLHWDGKTFQKRGYTDKRVAVVVSRGSFSRVIGVVNVKTGLAADQTAAIWELMLETGLENSIHALSHDTENTNTGHNSGICTRLQQLLPNDTLRTPCRHHIDEITLKTAFISTVEFGQNTTSPTIPLFENFCKRFHDPDFIRGQYSGIENDDFFDAYLQMDERVELVRFCKMQLLYRKAERKDYDVLLRLVILLLSPADRASKKIAAPTSYSRARFMGRIIYCLQIYLYRDQFALSELDLEAIKTFILFVLKGYINHWFVCGLAICAPRVDLDFLKALNTLREILPHTADAALQKFKSHMWYLSDHNIAIAFFDYGVSFETKRAMCQNLQRDSAQPYCYRFQLNETASIDELSLEDFVSNRTMDFFVITGINPSFLDKDPTEWATDPHFLHGRETVKNLQVTNDHAERAIATYQTLEKQAKTDKRRNSIIHMVEDHRKKFSSMNKGNIIAKLTERTVVHE